MDVKDILRFVERTGGAFGSALGLPPGLGVALDAIAEGAGLAADLVEHGHPPAVVIREFRAVVPEFAASKQRLKDYMEELLARSVLEKKP